MMKLYFKFDDDVIIMDGRIWRPDYQSFCRKYKEEVDLVLAAGISLNIDVTV